MVACFLSLASHSLTFTRMSHSSPLCAVIILNWMRAAETIQCCDSVLASDYDQLALFICDNGSPDGSYDDIVAALAPRGAVTAQQPRECTLTIAGMHRSIPITIIQNGINRGYAAGNNEGIRRGLSLGAEFVLVLNNDCVVVPNSIKLLIDAASSDTRYGLTGALICDERDRLQVQSIGGGRFNPWLCRVTHAGQGRSLGSVQQTLAEGLPVLDYVSGACVLVRGVAAQTVGLMREDFFLYFEELDWSLRMRDAGWTIGVARHALVYHADLKADHQRRAYATYYYVRNGMRIIREYFPWALLSALIATIARIPLLAIRGRFAEAKAVFFGILAFVGALGLGPSTVQDRSGAAT